MLRKVLDVRWRQHMTNKELYGEIPPISSVIRKRMFKFSGQCFRQSEDPVSELVLWEPRQGTRRYGCPEKTYIDILKDNTGVASTDELVACMKDQEVWRGIVSRRPAKSINRWSKCAFPFAHHAYYYVCVFWHCWDDWFTGVVATICLLAPCLFLSFIDELIHRQKHLMSRSKGQYQGFGSQMTPN